jgi:hypothetical protein
LNIEEKREFCRGYSRAVLYLDAHPVKVGVFVVIRGGGRDEKRSKLSGDDPLEQLFIEKFEPNLIRSFLRSEIDPEIV